MSLIRIRPTPAPPPATLLKNVSINMAKKLTEGDSYALSTVLLRRMSAWNKILKSPKATQTAIRDVAARSSKPDQMQLADILTQVIGMSFSDRQKFKKAFSKLTVATVFALRRVAAAQPSTTIQMNWNINLQGKPADVVTHVGSIKNFPPELVTAITDFCNQATGTVLLKTAGSYAIGYSLVITRVAGGNN